MNQEYDTPCCRPEFWWYLSFSALLVSLAGITSGLALGLLSFSQVDLEVLIKAGKPLERVYAAKIKPLVKDEHLLLCTLLIVKTLAIEALPIFIDSILPVWAAIVMSGILVLAAAEIIPQAVCSRYGLSIGAHSAALVYVLQLVFYPIAYPISKLLDWMLGGEHAALYRRAELKTLVDLHANEAGKGGELSVHERTIISGALDMTQKTAKNAMTPISETFSLDINSKLDRHTMGLILSNGHSRIPVYSGNPSNLIGIVLVKNLMFQRPEEEIPIKLLNIRRLPRVHEDWPLYDILSQFRKGHSHMAVVVKSTQDTNNIVHIPVDSSMNPGSLPTQAAQSEAYSRRTQKNEILDSNSYSNDAMSGNTMHKIMIEEDKSLQSKASWVHANETISNEDLETLRSNLNKEKAIGIITMEDVIEELLQEEILDETDEYVDVHKKIRINLTT